MQAPRGGLAPKASVRPGVPEDDQTFAPPPMSAYSIAVLSSNAAQAHQTSHSNQALPAEPFTWRFSENAALRESLKRKLSSHFHNSPTAASNTSGLPPPRSPQTTSGSPPFSVRSPAGTSNTPPGPRTKSGSIQGLSNSPGGLSGTVSAVSGGLMDQSSSGSSHSTANSNSASFTSFHSAESEVDLATSGARSKSFNGSDLSRHKIRDTNRSLPIKASLETTPITSSAHEPSPNQRAMKSPVLGSESESSIARQHIYSSAPRKRSFPPPENGKVSTSPPSNEAVNIVSRSLRPLSNGHATRQSRLNRRFRSLGPPKRASEMAFDVATSPSNEKGAPGELHFSLETFQTKTPVPESNSTPSLQIGEHKSDASVSRKALSKDAEFFKSLRKLKETSQMSQSVPDFAKISSSSVSTSPRATKAQISFTSSETGNASAQKSPFVPSGFHRQPLQDIPPESFNIPRGQDGFKKPKIPKPHIPEQRAIPQDPTPQIPLKPVANKNNMDSSTSSSSLRSAESGKKVIQLNAREYEKLEVLGKGGTSKVYKVRSLSDKKSYALKKVSFDQFDESCVRGFKGEIDLLMKLRNETRVVSLVDHMAGSGSLYLLMECGDLDLAHALQNKISSDPNLDPNFVRFHASEIFHCIKAVHNAGIVHSDLKPANFLFVGGILKIIDFGIANAVPEHTVNIYRNSQIGTPNYMAPEALVEVNNTLGFSSKTATTTWRVGKPSDIWSCGCIIYQMIYGRPPYAAYSGQQRIMAIMNQQVKVKFAPTGLGGVSVPSSAKTLMKKCLERDPSDRWTVDECLNSDFLKPKAVNQHFVEDLLRNAVALGQKNPSPDSIGEETYNELVSTILGQIRNLNIA